MQSPVGIPVLIVLGGYLLGSVLPAEWFVRRKTGRSAHELAENPGGAGTYRLAGFWAAAFVSLFDIAKGLAPVALADSMGLEGAWLVAAACAPVAGHNWPIYRGFRPGGKGMAAALGASVLLGWPSILPGLGIGAVLVLWRRWAPWIGVAGLPLGLLGMGLAGMPAARLWGVVGLILLMLLRLAPWLNEQWQARRKTGRFPPPGKSW